MKIKIYILRSSDPEKFTNSWVGTDEQEALRQFSVAKETWDYWVVEEWEHGYLNKIYTSFVETLSFKE